MDPIERRELKRRALMRLAAQRRRAGLLRGRVLAISMICFAALWAIVFTQMETGNDPVLAGKEPTVATRVAMPSAGQEVETTDPRELRPRGEDDEEEEEEEEEDRPRREEATIETEPEAEPQLEELTPEVEEPETVFAEEPLVTSQS
jgi:hypothetical protein